MDTHHLRAFLAVVRLGSYTRAASELNLSQSAVWRQMRSLEQELGSRLLEQIGKSLHVTDAGRTLAGEAQQLVAQLGRVEESLRARDGRLHGRLRIGASTTPAYYLLPRIVGEFARRHPGLDLRYEVGNSARIQRLLAENDLDIGFVGGRVDNDELLAERLIADEVVCFAAPSHPIAKRRRVSPAMLMQELCIVREPGSATRKLFENWLAREGLELTRTLVIGCPEALKLLVAGGLGCSYLSRHGIAPEVRRGELKELKVVGTPLVRPILALRHRDKHVSAPMNEFLELCRGLGARSQTRSGRRVERRAGRV